MSELVKLLRDAANEMRKEGHDGWPNTCDWGADEIESLRSRLAELQDWAHTESLNTVRLNARIADLEAERALLVTRAENAEAALVEADRNEETLLGMIRHQRDVLRECLPYLNESMAGKRPGRSADDIRAAVKALTSASADGPKGEK